MHRTRRCALLAGALALLGAGTAAAEAPTGIVKYRPGRSSDGRPTPGAPACARPSAAFAARGLASCA